MKATCFFSKTLLIAIVCCGWLASAETDSFPSTAPQVKATVATNNSTTETNSPNSVDQLNRHYVEILEKTNEQLSLWWNPLGVFVGALGVLFAVGAIVAGIIIYRQSTDYKKSLKEFENTYRVILDRIIQEKTAQLETFKTTIDASIKEQQQQLQTASAEHKSEIESAIQNLERVKSHITERLQRPATLPEFLAPTGTLFPTLAGFPPVVEKFHQCSRCKFGFKVYNPLYSTSAPMAVCPNCGNIDQI